jgi:Na+/H+ antiporter NhaC
MTDSLGAKQYVAGLVENSAGGLKMFLPAIVFIIACFLAFATGTSWGTFGILIPICIAAFPVGAIRIVSISACMAGAVCGDHCSPISDTTIMASAGAQCVHVNHVSTQLPYAITCAAVSFVTYLVAGLTLNLGVVASGIISWVVGLAALAGTLIVLKKRAAKKA